MVMFGNEGVVVEAGKAIDVSHHACWAMDDLKEVSKKFLGPAADLMDRASVVQNFFDSTAVAQPKEFGAPKELAILTDGPAATARFTDKGMIVPFSFGAAARAKSYWAEAGTVHGEVEGTCSAGTKEGKGELGRVGMIGLHENPAHARTGPVCLQEAW